MPKDHPDFINGLESLPQCKPKDHPDSIACLELLPLHGIPFDEHMKELKEYKDLFKD